MLHFTEYDNRLAGYAVITRDESILLTWFNGSNPCWSLPGGGIEFDESVEEGVIREAKEESGYDIALGSVLGTSFFTDTGPERDRPFKSVRILYAAEVIGGTLGTLEVGGTTDRAEWIPFDDSPGFVAPTSSTTRSRCSGSRWLRRSGEQGAVLLDRRVGHIAPTPRQRVLSTRGA